jgi:hypothetical protein
MITNLSVIVQQRIGLARYGSSCIQPIGGWHFVLHAPLATLAQCSRAPTRLRLAVAAAVTRKARRSKMIPLKPHTPQLTGVFSFPKPAAPWRCSPQEVLKPARKQRFIDRSDFKAVYKSESPNHLFGSLID